MTLRIRFFTTIAVAALLVGAPASLYAQQPASPADHAGHHPETVAASAQAAPAAGHDHQVAGKPESGPKLDELVLKMNAATGAARVDAMAELLTALVQKHQDCEPMMADMMKKMGTMDHSAHDGGAAEPPAR